MVSKLFSDFQEIIENSRDILGCSCGSPTCLECPRKFDRTSASLESSRIFKSLSVKQRYLGIIVLSPQLLGVLSNITDVLWGYFDHSRIFWVSPEVIGVLPNILVVSWALPSTTKPSRHLLRHLEYQRIFDVITQVFGVFSYFLIDKQRISSMTENSVYFLCYLNIAGYSRPFLCYLENCRIFFLFPAVFRELPSFQDISSRDQRITEWCF